MLRPAEGGCGNAAVRKRRRGGARRTFQLVMAQKHFLLPPRVCRRGTAGSRDKQDKGCFACTPMSLIKTVAGRCPCASVGAPRWARCAVEAAIAAAAGRAMPRCAITLKHFSHYINMSTSLDRPKQILNEKTLAGHSRYGEASATAASWRANDGGRQRKTACPLLYR